jgi:hypothetical protein
MSDPNFPDFAISVRGFLVGIRTYCDPVGHFLAPSVSTVDRTFNREKVSSGGKIG